MNSALHTTNRYARPRLAWIKARARRLVRFYGVSRRLAIADAALDYATFVGAAARPAGLRLIRGGRS